MTATYTNTIARKAILAVVAFGMFTAASLNAAPAEASTLTIGAAVGDTSAVQCAYRPNHDGSAAVTSMFNGPAGQWVYYTTKVWKVVGSGFELSYQSPNWMTTQVSAANYATAVQHFTLPAGNSWLVEIETWRWTPRSGFTHHNVEIARPRTTYNGISYPGFCLS